MESNITSQQFEAAVKQWSDRVRRQAKARTSAFTKGKEEKTRYYKHGRYAGKTEGKLKDNIRVRIHRSYGEIDNVAFLIPVHGIFREYGVGRGQPITGPTARTVIRRSPSDWMTDPIDKNFPVFADLAGEYYGDRILLNVAGMGVDRKNNSQ